MNLNLFLTPLCSIEYEEFDAYWRNEKISHNPYTEPSCKDQWERGWLQAQKQDDEDTEG